MLWNLYDWLGDDRSECSDADFPSVLEGGAFHGLHKSLQSDAIIDIGMDGSFLVYALEEIV